MYAVIKTGGKQYKVAKDQLIEVERLAGEAGETVAIESVLMIGEGETATVGAPFVAGATVAAEIVEQTRGPKIIVFKKKRRKNYRRKNGHRQDLTLLKVTEILTDGQMPAVKKAAAKPKAEKPAPEPKAEAPKAEAPKAEPEAAPVEAEAAAPAEDITPDAPATLDAPQGEADDLKKLGGVGPKLEEKLNSIGIYHYRQLAELTPAQVAWAEEQLGFKAGRIDRDDWVGQAKALAEEQGE